MGQQQLLLVVLTVILVGVAVVLGIQYFSVGAEQGAKDELVAHCLTVGANAQEWFKKPVAMGGGGLSFAGFDAYYAANMVKLQTSTNGTYEVDVTATTATVTGTPIVALGYTWTVKADVTVDNITTTIIPGGGGN